MPLILDPETKPLDLHGRLAILRRKARSVSAMSGGMALAAAHRSQLFRLFLLRGNGDSKVVTMPHVGQLFSCCLHDGNA